MKRKLLLTALALPLVLSAADVKEEELTILESGGQALIIRSAAISNPKTALTQFFQPQAGAAWDRLVAPTFEGNRSYEISDFFNTSLVLSGAQQAESGIIAFYSPWQDAVLLIRTVGKGAARRGAEFLFLTGETFRGETFQDSLEVVTPLNAPLSVNLWRVYSRTVQKFNALYPAEGTPDMAALRKGVDQDAEFQHIRLRSIARTVLAKKLTTPAYRTGLANCLLALRGLQNGNEKVLKNLFGSADPVGAVAGLNKIPMAIRKNIEPVYSLVSENSSLFGFLNPGAPRFVFLVNVDQEGKFHLEWFDLEESANLYRAWEEAK